MKLSDGTLKWVLELIAEKIPVARLAVIVVLGVFAFAAYHGIQLIETIPTKHGGIHDPQNPNDKHDTENKYEIIPPGYMFIRVEEYMRLLKLELNSTAAKEKPFDDTVLLKIDRLVKEVDKSLINLVKNTGANRASLIQLTDSDFDIVWHNTAAGPHKFYYNCYRSYVASKNLSDYCYIEFDKKPYEIMVEISEKLRLKRLVRVDYSKAAPGWPKRFMEDYEIGTLFFYPVFSIPGKYGKDMFLGFIMLDFAKEVEFPDTDASNMAIMRMMLSTANAIQLSLAVTVDG